MAAHDYRFNDAPRGRGPNVRVLRGSRVKIEHVVIDGLVHRRFTSVFGGMTISKFLCRDEAYVDDPLDPIEVITASLTCVACLSAACRVVARPRSTRKKKT